MRKSQKTNHIIRSFGVIAAVLMIVSGVTFAALQTQQNVLTGNTIQTATANLQLSTDGTTYSDSHVGFDFNNLVPGGAALPVAGHSFYLKNAGGTPLALKFAINSSPSNPGGVDLSKVNVLLSTVGSGTGAQVFSVQSLVASASSGGLAIRGTNLPSGVTQQYKLQVQMAVDAVSGSSASLGNIDFAFSGIAQSN
ncbi:MAG: hypothetical protein AAB971_04300 [Patescibacteria group bacterium]